MAFEDGFVEFMVEKKTTTKDVIIRGLSWGLMAAVLIAPYPFFGSPIYIPMALFIEIFLWLGYRYFVIRHTQATESCNTQKPSQYKCRYNFHKSP